MRNSTRGVISAVVVVILSVPGLVSMIPGQGDSMEAKSQGALGKGGLTADLVANDIWTSPNPPIGTHQVTIYYKISDETSMDAVPTPPATSFLTILNIDGVYADGQSLSMLAWGSSHTFTYQTVLSPGPHTLDLIVDVHDTVYENVEWDNELTEIINWQNACEKYAILVAGGNDDNGVYWSETEEAYNALTLWGYTDGAPDSEDHIYYLSPNTTDGHHDALNSVANIQWAIDVWLDRSDSNDRVFIYFVGHGENGNQFEDYYGNFATAADIATRIEEEIFYSLTFVIDCCSSGGWTNYIDGPNRIVISATARNSTTEAANNHIFVPGDGPYATGLWDTFSHVFWYYVVQSAPQHINGNSLDYVPNGAFRLAKAATESIWIIQHPSMDDQISGTWWLNS